MSFSASEAFKDSASLLAECQVCSLGIVSGRGYSLTRKCSETIETSESTHLALSVFKVR